jgi:hypothetical protein
MNKTRRSPQLKQANALDYYYYYYYYYYQRLLIRVALGLGRVHARMQLISFVVQLNLSKSCIFGSFLQSRNCVNHVT